MRLILLVSFLSISIPNPIFHRQNLLFVQTPYKHDPALSIPCSKSTNPLPANYASYGCNPIPEYFWYNTGHITYHTHEILAKEVGKFLEGQS